VSGSERPKGGYQGLYRMKPAAQGMVDPLVAWAIRHGVRPNVISAAAILVSACGALAIAASPTVPALLFLVPFAAAARLVLNLMDGLVARRTGLTSATGEMWNELGDRVCDVLLIGSLALVPAVGPALAFGAVIASLLASYAGITARAAGGRRQYGGIMSKPGRMIVLSVAAPLSVLLAEPRILWAGTLIILIGALLTLAQRLRAAARDGSEREERPEGGDRLDGEGPVDAG